MDIIGNIFYEYFIVKGLIIFLLFNVMWFFLDDGVCRKKDVFE